jgi:hypothetical protein
MRMRRTLLVVAVIFLSGCSGVPYAPKGSTVYKGGYTDQKIAEGEYLVRFEGNGFNTMPQVVEFVNRRAAELCGSPNFEAKMREYVSSNTEIGYAGGMVYPSRHQFPNAEAQVKCK